MSKIKVVVFDLGGTLMEYRGLPNSWLDYYKSALEYVNKELNLNLSDDAVLKSEEILRSFNPRINYREEDFSPEYIFKHVTENWSCSFDLKSVIDKFFESFHFDAHIYDDSVETLKRLKEKGFKVCALTDVAVGMPDELHKGYCSELLPFFDMYISSVSCGFRKPNPRGLCEIAEECSACSENMIFVGDEQKDILTAKNFGCVSVYIDRKNNQNDFGQDFTIYDLSGLEEILNN